MQTKQEILHRIIDPKARQWDSWSMAIRPMGGFDTVIIFFFSYENTYRKYGITSNICSHEAIG